MCPAPVAAEQPAAARPTRAEDTGLMVGLDRSRSCCTAKDGVAGQGKQSEPAIRFGAQSSTSWGGGEKPEERGTTRNQEQRGRGREGSTPSGFRPLINTEAHSGISIFQSHAHPSQRQARQGTFASIFRAVHSFLPLAPARVEFAPCRLHPPPDHPSSDPVHSGQRPRTPGRAKRLKMFGAPGCPVLIATPPSPIRPPGQGRARASRSR